MAVRWGIVSTASPVGGAGAIEVVPLAARRDLAAAMWAATDPAWPMFMLHDAVGNLYYPRLERDFADWCLLALGPQDQVVARACFVPFAGGVDDLPDRGWDAIIERGVADHDAGRSPTAASALEIVIVPGARGRGLSRVMLDHMRRAVGDLGLVDLVAPVRPSGKHAYPHEAMDDYLARTTPDGLVFDPWLRVHERAGGTIMSVAQRSMTITGTTAQWHDWTGMTFDHEGEVVVPQALVPVLVDLAADQVTYVEPNVWVHHDLRP